MVVYYEMYEVGYDNGRIFILDLRRQDSTGLVFAAYLDCAAWVILAAGLIYADWLVFVAWLNLTVWLIRADGLLCTADMVVNNKRKTACRHSADAGEFLFRN